MFPIETIISGVNYLVITILEFTVSCTRISTFPGNVLKVFLFATDSRFTNALEMFRTIFVIFCRCVWFYVIIVEVILT